MATNYFPVNNVAPNPAYYQHIWWITGFGSTPVPDPSVAANGIHYPGDSVNIWMQGVSTATSYKVFDWYGNIVTSGSLGGSTQLFTVTPPGGGWQLGWYRIYLAGASTDPTWGDTYASSVFSFVRSSSRFPAMPSSQTYYQGGTDSDDFVRKAAFGYGTSRFVITNGNAPTTGTDTIATCTTGASFAAPAWTQAPSAYLDPVRPRYLWCTFPNGSVNIVFPNGLGSLMAKDAATGANGDKIFVEIVTGVLNVYYPNNTTLVESFGPITSSAQAMTLVNGVSDYITVYGTQTGTPTNMAKVAVGNTYWNGVVQAVQALYPLGITHWEGATNEPTLTSPYVVGMMRQFALCVHAAEADAVVIGPTPVAIDYPLNTTGWNTYLAGGGATFSDHVAFHAYNATAGGDINLGTKELYHFTRYLDKYGASTDGMWQTESTWSNFTNYGLMQTRAVAWEMRTSLLFEQFGVPRERNNHWYDGGHAFWSVPAWWQTSNGSIYAPPILARVLADETWGLVHREKIVFGELADNIFIGSIFGKPGEANVAVVCAGSYMPTSTVTFRLFGPTQTSLTYSDPWGNLLTLTVTSNLVTMPVQDIPSYLRLPQGVRVQVDHVNDWPSTSMPNLAGQATTFTINNGSTSCPELVDGRQLWDYGTYVSSTLAGGGQRTSAATVIPGSATDTAVLLFPGTISTDRVIIWAGNIWQKASTLIDFDVQTTVNGGSTWTTQTTINKASNADNNTYQHGSAQRDMACQTETWWDMQNIFDVNLGGAVSCNGVRLLVRRTSYGGAPTANASAACAFWGSADTAQHLTLQEIAVVDSTHARPTKKVQTFSSGQIPFGPRGEHLAPVNGKFVVGGWCNPTGVATRQVIASCGDTADKWEFGIWSTGVPYLSKATAGGGTVNLLGSQTCTTNTWQYIAAVVDIGGGTVRLLRVLEDGTYVGANVSDSHPAAYGPPIIGSGPSAANQFAGKICQVAVWMDTTLTDSEVVWAALHGADRADIPPLFYAPLMSSESISTDVAYGLTGTPTGTTLSGSGFPAISEACNALVGV